MASGRVFLDSEKGSEEAFQENSTKGSEEVFRENSEKGSEEVFQFACTVCSKDNKLAEAIKQCTDCDEFFCGICLEFHNKLNATAGHQLLGKDKMKAQTNSASKDLLPRDRCQVHPGERITAYCADHDSVCCDSCVSNGHNSCYSIDYIVRASRRAKSSTDFFRTKKDVESTLLEVTKKKTELQKQRAELNDDSKTDLRHVGDFAERLIKRIKDLEKLDIDRIQTWYKENDYQIAAEIVSLDDAVSALEDSRQKLDEFSQNTECQVFVDVKTGRKNLVAAKDLLEEISVDKPSLNYTSNKGLEHHLEGLVSLGNLADKRSSIDAECTATFPAENKIYKAKLHGEYDIKSKKAKKTCDSIGSCFLPDGSIVLVDANNELLTYLDPSYNAIKKCVVPGGPWGLACIGPTEVAVTVTLQKKVQFVSVGKSMSLTKSFSTIQWCKGICFSNWELFVSCGDPVNEAPGLVAIYSVSGALIRTIQTDQSSKPIFTWPQHITASPDGSRLHIVQDSCLITLNRETDCIISSFTDPGLKNAANVCILDNDNVLVCGRDSHNILQVDRNGRKVEELLNREDGIEFPQSLCYDSSSCRLVVTMNRKNNIKVFDLM